ncbi:amidophosphoribosyltransferase [Pyrobaculum neutrophilum]|uniref:Amidophosphoribosyltransferase n=1 Tax=Pyrobaculum neutrophilum (strain DSM 2338 / JCM 9278 / NBRC 100436 / V24Sta) TaxID=444157 RepID=B1YBM4_PYRNV|nr:amidophosphoribosyltransferase [Pyrobaculum neutrophilum]ACB40826.1 Amidophosphoribosyltransferase [Pyrobaculum neutrophilum V24Sta]
MCGIGAVWGKGAGAAALRMANWLVHRGHEGVGYAYLEGGAVKLGRPPEDAPAAVVHTRYSTSGPYGVSLQPVYARYRDLELAVAFNGTVVNFRQLDSSASFDGEALARSLAREIWERGVEEGVQEVYRKIVGAASTVALTPWGIIAVRDPRGVRPLAVSYDQAGARVASETVALGDGIELAPGVALLYGSRISTWKVDPKPARLCALEYVYFAHPASKLEGRLVADVRRALGRALAEGEEVKADAVAYVPETARHAAAGFAEVLGLEVVDAVVKNRFSGRLFIKPPGERKAEEVFQVVKEYVAGRRIFLVDDSLIRGTNIRAIVWMLKRAGAAEVHVRIASPPIRWPCFFGMDFQRRSELVAWGREVEEVRQIVGADTLRYISMEKFREVLGDSVCYGCFTGVYPQEVDVEWAERELARFK